MLVHNGYKNFVFWFMDNPNTEQLQAKTKESYTNTSVCHINMRQDCSVHGESNLKSWFICKHSLCKFDGDFFIRMYVLSIIECLHGIKIIRLKLEIKREFVMIQKISSKLVIFFNYNSDDKSTKSSKMLLLLPLFVPKPYL